MKPHSMVTCPPAKHNCLKKLASTLHGLLQKGISNAITGWIQPVLQMMSQKLATSCMQHALIHITCINTCMHHCTLNCPRDCLIVLGEQVTGRDWLSSRWILCKICQRNAVINIDDTGKYPVSLVGRIYHEYHRHECKYSLSEERCFPNTLV